MDRLYFKMSAFFTEELTSYFIYFPSMGEMPKENGLTSL